MFQLTEMTEAHVASVTNRTETHGDEKVPAVSIGLEITCANTILDLIDPSIRTSLFKRAEGQEDLPGIEPSTPVLACHSLETVKLTTSHEGWTLEVDDGIDDTTPMSFGGVKVDKLTVEPKQGGSIVLRLRCGTSDIDAERLGKLGMHNGQSIWITLRQPKKAAEAIDGTTEAFERDHPQADATDMFVAGAGADAGGDGDGGAESAAAAADGEPGDNWPFPRDGEAVHVGTDMASGETQGAESDTEGPASRTKRRRTRAAAAAAE